MAWAVVTDDAILSSIVKIPLVYLDYLRVPFCFVCTNVHAFLNDLKKKLILYYLTFFMFFDHFDYC